MNADSPGVADEDQIVPEGRADPMTPQEAAREAAVEALSPARLRERAVVLLAKGWNRQKAAQTIDYIDQRAALKEAVIAYLVRPDHTERDKVIADIRRRLPLVAVGWPDLAEIIRDAMDRVDGRASPTTPAPEASREEGGA